MPFGDVWEEFLRREKIESNYLNEVKTYEKEVLSKR
ncbi:MAG: L-rhamnose isomerase [Clostridia bacterium]|nr:L-rhamnose isomerase [Clostridia bacterium]